MTEIKMTSEALDPIMLALFKAHQRIPVSGHKVNPCTSLPVQPLLPYPPDGAHWLPSGTITSRKTDTKFPQQSLSLSPSPGGIMC